MSRALSPEQRQSYERDGYLLPFDVLGADEVARFRADFERLEPQLGGPAPGPQPGQCHLHFRWAYELATHPPILDLVEGVIGPDVLVHGTTVFCKQPRDPAFVSWHQDAHNWRLDEPRLVTAWVALSESTVENGCMRVIPGSHHGHVAHEARPERDNMLSVTGLTVSEDVDESRAVEFVLRPGQISLHHADLIHGSNPNRSDGKRIGFAIRYVSPEVGQASEHHPVVLARGADEHGNYEMLAEPPSSAFYEGLERHARFWRRRATRAKSLQAEPAS